MRVLILMLCIISIQVADCQTAASVYPSLGIHGNSRGMSMGDMGIATATGTQALLYNPAVIASGRYQHELSFSYMPWLTGIAADMRHIQVSYLRPLNESSAMGLALGYLDLGQIDLRDNNGATLASYHARDYHLDLSYALQLATQHGVSMTIKGLGQSQFGNTPVNRYSVAATLGYYGWINLKTGSKKIKIGAVVSDLGALKNLPATLGMGIAYEQVNESGDQWTLGLDMSCPLKSSEKNMGISMGMEYGLGECFFIRGGLSLEPAQAGARKFFSLGTGYRGYISDQAWNIDLFYLVPLKDSGGLTAFQQQYGLTLGIQIGNFQ